MGAIFLFTKMGKSCHGGTTSNEEVVSSWHDFKKTRN